MVNAGLLSKGTTLSYIENGNVKTIAGVRSIPTVGSDPEKVDVTNLGSSKKRYVKGLQDTDNLEFSVIYKGENFKDIHRLVELDKPLEWLVMYPDGMTVRFTGEVMQKIDGVEVNTAIGFSIVIVVSEGPSIEFAKEPSRPTALKASNVQFDQFNLSWNGSGLFRIYVDRNNVGETYNNTFTVTGLKPSSKHIVSVANVSGVNEVHTVPITVTTTELPKITKINVPQRLDLYVDETKQLDVSTVPGEAMRAYEHVNKAVLDNSIVKFDGDNITGIKSVNDENVFKQNIIAELSAVNGLEILNNTEKEIEIFNDGSVWSRALAIKPYKKTKGEKCLLTFEILPKTELEVIGGHSVGHKIIYTKINGERYSDFYNGIEYDFKKGELYSFEQLIEFTVDDDSVSQNSSFIIRFTNKENEYKTHVVLKNIKCVCGEISDPNGWSPFFNSNYSYTSANVTFDDDEKSSADFDIFVHKRERMTSPTTADTASFIL